MTRFVAEVEVAAPASAVWERLVDWPAHQRWVPATRVRVLTARPDGVGARFVGRSSLAGVGLDRVGFDDPMEVTAWSPPSAGRPGYCAVRKLGSVVRGTAAFDVVPLGPELTTVRWLEDIELAPVALTRMVSPVVALVGRLSFTRVLRAMASELVAGRGGAGTTAGRGETGPAAECGETGRAAGRGEP